MLSPQQWTQRHCGPNVICENITGEVSGRSYARLKFPNNTRTLVVGIDPSAPSGPDIIENAQILKSGPLKEHIAPHRLIDVASRFANTTWTRTVFWTGYLQKNKMPVPAIAGLGPGKALLFEDVGHQDLGKVCGGVGGYRASVFEEQSLNALRRLHQLRIPEPPFPILSMARRKMAFEMVFMLRHLRLVPGLEKAIDGPTIRFFLRSCYSLFLPLFETARFVLNHRDFHCRNIFIDGAERPRIIDYQDILFAAPEYDLASFTMDPYIRRPPQRILELLEAYYGRRPQPAELRRYFLYSIQRLFKVAGTYIYTAVTKKEDRYLPALERALENLTLWPQLCGQPPLPPGLLGMSQVLQQALGLLQGKKWSADVD